MWQEGGSALADPVPQRHAPPLPGGTAVSMLHCPLNRFKSALALLSSIPSRLELSLAPWGRTTLVQSPVPCVPNYRGHTRPPPACMHPAPVTDVQHLGVHPEPGAESGRLRREKGGGEGGSGGSARSASAPRFTSTHLPPAPPSELLAPDSGKAEGPPPLASNSHRIQFPRS